MAVRSLVMKLKELLLPTMVWPRICTYNIVLNRRPRPITSVTFKITGTCTADLNQTYSSDPESDVELAGNELSSQCSSSKCSTSDTENMQRGALSMHSHMHCIAAANILVCTRTHVLSPLSGRSTNHSVALYPF